MTKRISLSTDLYQESHLASVFHTWSRVMYGVLALFTGSMAAMVYLQKGQLIAIPMLGWVGYFMFQVLTLGICIIGFYGALWSMKKGEIEQGIVSFSWWGFWIRDLFMALVFFPFAIIITRMLFSGGGKGVFIDMGGWDGLLDPSKSWWEFILLVGMAIIIGGVILVMALIPVWFLWRSVINLGIQLKRGNALAQFDAKSYYPGDTLTVKVRNSRQNKSNSQRRIFVNLLERDPYAQPPATKKNHQRQYLYSAFQDVTVAELAAGISFNLPAKVAEISPTSAHTDSNQIRYWEILVEEPEKMYWARFLFLVE